jgi:RND superfamily putative drug exporter
VLGHRVDALAPRRWRRHETATETGFWYRLSRAVMRRPVPIAVGATVLLLVLGLPFLGVKFTGFDASVLPKDTGARQVDDALRRDFPPGRGEPVTVALEAPRSAGPRVRAYARRLRALPSSASVAPPRHLSGDTWEVDVFSDARAFDPATQDLVRDVRATPAPGQVLVGGEAARFVDRQDTLACRLPIALAILVVTTLLILWAMTGSVILPVKALVMNLLTVSAAFGLLVLVFQDGRLEGLLDYTSQGALESSQPLVLLAVAFGLSTDYGVFLLTRIKEVHDAGASNEDAVAIGLQRTGRIVTAAALLFSVALAAFATSQIVFIKELGLGAVAAVLIDATIVRALLVPSLMKLLGDWNWWAPAPLRRLHAKLRRLVLRPA